MRQPLARNRIHVGSHRNANEKNKPWKGLFTILQLFEAKLDHGLWFPLMQIAVLTIDFFEVMFMK